MSDHDGPPIAERQNALIASLREKGIPISPALEDAFRAAPRHFFVPGVYLDAVYRDEVIVTKRDKDGLAISSCSQPAITAIMLDALGVGPGHNVLEIGAGTGYNAALLAALAGEGGHVTTLEIDPEMVEAARAHLQRAGFAAVDVIEADAAQGWAAGAPYDRIIATVGAWDIPTAWVDQLAEGGVIVAPLSLGGIQIGAALRKRRDGSLESVRLFPLGFIMLRGAAAGPDEHVQLPGSALTLRFGEGSPLDAVQLHTLFSDDQALAQFPLAIDRRHLGLFSYYFLFHPLPGYRFVTYSVDDNQLAYGLKNYGWGLISSTSACMVPFGDERVVHTFGSSDAYLELIRLAEAWDAADRPGLARSHLHVTAADRAPYRVPPGAAQTVRIFQRPQHNYTLWLEA